MSTTDRIAAAWRYDRAYLIAIASRILSDPIEAEDVVQDGFARLAVQRVEEIEDLRAWLVVVVRRLALDRLGSAHRRLSTPSDPQTLARAGPAAQARAPPTASPSMTRYAGHWQWSSTSSRPRNGPPSCSMTCSGSRSTGSPSSSAGRRRHAVSWRVGHDARSGAASRRRRVRLRTRTYRRWWRASSRPVRVAISRRLPARCTPMSQVGPRSTAPGSGSRRAWTPWRSGCCSSSVPVPAGSCRRCRWTTAWRSWQPGTASRWRCSVWTFPMAASRRCTRCSCPLEGPARLLTVAENADDGVTEVADAGVAVRRQADGLVGTVTAVRHCERRRSAR
ncbi:hypothetical protein FXW78_25570 [Rhodococcus opacus]|nr:hypothetical protein [Rhodococcus opacus]